MALWDDIATLALIGTERKKSPLPATVGRLGRLFAALPGDDPEAALLGAVAATTVHRRAGILPETSTATLEPCAPETLRPCPPGADLALEMILAGGVFRETLAEWLDLAARARCHAPFRLLPDLLERGARDVEARRAIAAVCGARGRWLAGFNPAWRYASVGGDAVESPETVWTTGDRTVRVELVKLLRESDPTLARELVVSTWKEDDSADRAAFLAHFKTGLSMDDEPFLESVLDDRRKEVRQAAVELLACLPESRLVGRMIERAGKCLRFERADPSVVRVELPTECDKTMIRDGIEKGAEAGMRSRRLSSMLACIPPSFWCREWNVTPVEMVLGARNSGWNDVIMERGWVLGAFRHADREWAEALILDDLTIGQTITTGIFALAPTDVKQRQVLDWMKKCPVLDVTTLGALHQCGDSWGRELSEAMTERLVLSLRLLDDTRLAPDWLYALDSYARKLDPAVFPRVQESIVLPNIAARFAVRQIEAFLDVLHFRYKLHSAFAESTQT